MTTTTTPSFEDAAERCALLAKEKAGRNLFRFTFALVPAYAPFGTAIICAPSLRQARDAMMRSEGVRAYYEALSR